MKKQLILLIFFTIPALAQEHPVDSIFDQYAGKDGFTTVNISANILKMIDSNDATNNALADFTGIKILAVEDGTLNKKLDFSKDIIKKLDRKQYKELMVVKEKDQEVLMLIRENGKTISEFLMVVGGSDNALISIRGGFTIDALRKLGGQMDVSGLKHLSKLDEK